MKQELNPWTELSAEWRAFEAKVKKPRRKPLKGWTYCHATIIADIFCDDSGRRDVTPDVRGLVGRAFAQLGALTGVAAPAFANTRRA